MLACGLLSTLLSKTHHLVSDNMLTTQTHTHTLSHPCENLFTNIMQLIIAMSAPNDDLNPYKPKENLLALFGFFSFLLSLFLF